MSNSEIPVGSKWRDKRDGREYTAMSEVGFVGDIGVSPVVDGLRMRSLWDASKYERIDVPAAPAVRTDDSGLMEAAAAPAVRLPKPGETWRWQISGGLPSTVLVRSFDGQVVHDGNVPWNWIGGLCWTFVADAPAPEVCAYPGCGKDKDRPKHDLCGRFGCICMGIRRHVDCHDFVPPVSKTEIAAPAQVQDRAFLDSALAEQKATASVLRHDFSNPYLVRPDINGIKLRLCVACGAPKSSYMFKCWPRAGWRETLEAKIPCTISLPVDKPARHFHQPSLSAGIDLCGGIVNLRGGR